MFLSCHDRFSYDDGVVLLPIPLFAGSILYPKNLAYASLFTRTFFALFFFAIGAFLELRRFTDIWQVHVDCLLDRVRSECAPTIERRGMRAGQ